MEFFHKLTLWDPLPSNLPDFIAEFNSNRRLELATRRGAMPGTVDLGMSNLKSGTATQTWQLEIH